MTTLAEMRDQLAEHGSTHHVDGKGQKIMLVAGRMLPFAEPHDLLIAYEGNGAFLWDTRRKLTTFRLIEAGFGLTSAPTLVEVCNGLVQPMIAAREVAVRLKLDAPRGTREGE